MFPNLGCYAETLPKKKLAFWVVLKGYLSALESKMSEALSFITIIKG